MAGIFGVCRFDAAPIDRALVARMSETLAHDGRDGEGLDVSGSAALGCRILRTPSEPALRAQPVRRTSGIRVVFDGRLDNRDELIAALRDRYYDVSAAAPDAELAAASYERAGAEFARDLLGDFAVAVVDPVERRVVLARDAMGIRPLYYRRTDTSLFFGSAVRTLLVDTGFRAHPNRQLLAELMLRRTHRRQVDGSTLFAGVSQVLPAHVAIFTAAGTQLERYWDFDLRREEPAHTFEAYAETFRDLFQRAVKRRVRGAHPVAISVSGGLDSSSIFCAADKIADVPLVGLTYTPSDGGASDESAFVAELERACGRTIECVDAPMEGVLFRSDEMVRAVEAPMLSAQWSRGDRLMTAAAAAGARTLLTGHWGDQVLFDQAYLVDLLRDGAWGTVHAHLGEYPRWFPDARGHEFRVQLGADMLEHALPGLVRKTVRAAKHVVNRPEPWDEWFCESFAREARPDVFAYTAGATARARSLYREVRSQYHQITLEWNAKVAAHYGVEAAFPFLDRDLVEFLMGVPGIVLARGGVPKALLRESLRGTVPDAILRRVSKADFTEDVNRSMSQDLAALADLLTSQALVVQLGYVDADKLKRGLAGAPSALAQSSTSVVSWRIKAVAALELWLRHFIGHPETGREDMTWRKIGLVSAP